VGQWLERSPLVLKVSDTKHSLCMRLFTQTLSINPAVNGHLTLLRAVVREGSEGEE